MFSSWKFINHEISAPFTFLSFLCVVCTEVNTHVPYIYIYMQICMLYRMKWVFSTLHVVSGPQWCITCTLIVKTSTLHGNYANRAIGNIRLNCMWLSVYVCLFVCMCVCVSIRVYLCVCMCLRVNVFTLCATATTMKKNYGKFCQNGLAVGLLLLLYFYYNVLKHGLIYTNTVLNESGKSVYEKEKQWTNVCFPFHLVLYWRYLQTLNSSIGNWFAANLFLEHCCTWDRSDALFSVTSSIHT